MGTNNDVTRNAGQAVDIEGRKAFRQDDDRLSGALGKGNTEVQIGRKPIRGPPADAEEMPCQGR